MSLTQDDADIDADRSAFWETISKSFDDKRIIGYFSRGLVGRDQVTQRPEEDDVRRSTRVSEFRGEVTECQRLR